MVCPPPPTFKIQVQVQVKSEVSVEALHFWASICFTAAPHGRSIPSKYLFFEQVRYPGERRPGCWPGIRTMATRKASAFQIENALGTSIGSLAVKFSGSRFGFASYPLDVEGFGMISRLLDSTCTSLRSFDVKDHDDLSVRLFVAFEIQVSILVKG